MWLIVESVFKDLFNIWEMVDMEDDVFMYKVGGLNRFLFDVLFMDFV